MKRDEQLEVMTILLEVRAELRELRAQLVQCPSSDPLLHEIHAAIGDERFTTAALIEAADPQLLAALDGLDATGLGQRLRSLRGKEIDGLQVLRHERTADGYVWSVDRLHNRL